MTRYPQLDLASFIAACSGRAAARKVSKFNTLSWRLAESEGLSVEQADRIAGRLRRHPSELWPCWTALNVAEVAAERRAKNRERMRRYRAREDVRARVRERNRRYYEECAETLRAAQRRRYWQNPEAERERKRLERAS